METGKNTLQKTLLLRREAEVDKIQYELEKKKIDFDKRMEECRLKKEDLKLKQKVVIWLTAIIFNLWGSLYHKGNILCVVNHLHNVFHV